MPTIPQLFLDRVARAPDATAMHVRAGEAWGSRTWRESEAAVARTAAALAALGVGKGDRVAILGDPDPHWLESDFATLSLGGVTVGIYPTLTPEAVGWQLRHSRARVLLVQDPGRLSQLAGHIPDGTVALRWDFADEAPPADLAAFRARAAEVRPEDLCTLIYTSGTTGNPKGAAITHGAFHAVCVASVAALPLPPGARSIVYLPLAHSLQRMAAYRALLEDIEAWWCPTLDGMPALIPVARPHVILAVPRVLEKMKARIEAGIAEQPARRQRIVGWAFEVGRRVSDASERGAPVPALLALQHALAERLVLRTVRGRLGGSLEILAVGGAALNPEVARFFHALGIGVIEGWGLTETCAPATQNRRDDFRFGTVGKPLAGTELRLEADGEVLVRQPGMFAGYWEDPVATAAAFTEDGWFRTGDIGQIDADGFLRIIDRKKEILVTAGGKNIPPVNIEKRLEGGLVGQAVVIGDARPYLVALFAPDPERSGTPAERDAAAAARVAEVNAGLASFEQVKRWAWLGEPLTVENGCLTPTMKLKRRVIAERHRELIDELYRR